MKTKDKDSKQKAKEIMKSMSPIQGETRCVYKCLDCGTLFGRRFVPYSSGIGITVSACMCQLTSGGRPTKLIMESKP